MYVTNLPRYSRLLERVQRRLHWQRIGRLAWWCGGGAVLFYLAVVGLARMGGFFSLSPVAAIWGVVAVPCVALLLAYALARRPAPVEAAHAVDVASGGKELFLTAHYVAGESDARSGSYRELVLAGAEKAASEIAAERVVPLGVTGRQWGFALGCMAVLVAAALFTPTLDLSGNQASREKAAALGEKAVALQQQAAAVKARTEQMTAETKESVDALKELFQQAKPETNKADARKLTEQQKAVSRAWDENQREVQAVKASMERGAQAFGKQSGELQKAVDRLKAGDATALKEELNKLEKQMRAARESGDLEKQKAAANDAAKALAKLSEALRGEAGSPGMKEALQQAMQALQEAREAGDKDAAEAAMNAAQAAMGLSQEELEAMAAALRNSSDLESAMDALQKARALAQQGKLDGSQCSQCNGIGDYQKLYDQLMAGQSAQGQPSDQPGGAGGMGPKAGQGQGGVAHENDTANSGFKPEKSPTKLTAGQVLMQFGVKELGSEGVRPASVDEAVRAVREGVDEAIRQENVPAAYHDSIKRYFDAK
jgi:hypothetical protein